MTRQIREYEASLRLISIPVIGLTAMCGDETTQLCLNAGMNICLTKPLVTEELKHWLRYYLTGAPSHRADTHDY